MGFAKPSGVVNGFMLARTETRLGFIETIACFGSSSDVEWVMT